MRNTPPNYGGEWAPPECVEEYKCQCADGGCRGSQVTEDDRELYLCTSCGGWIIIPTVECRLCQERTPKATAHRHGRKWVGECCWDDRLKMTE